MTTRSTAAMLVTIGLAIAHAQAPDFSGTWKLDAANSRIVAAAGLAGLIAAGVPETLHITQPDNGTLVIESQINEGHSRIYRPGGKTSTPAAQGGTITMTTRWEGRALVAEGVRQATGGASASVKEVIALSNEGRTLAITVTTTDGGVASQSVATYTRIADVGACETWPTPCKRPRDQ